MMDLGVAARVRAIACLPTFEEGKLATQKLTEIDADASASKTFFISMLTRDIDLADCMLDLYPALEALFDREPARKRELI